MEAIGTKGFDLVPWELPCSRVTDFGIAFAKTDCRTAVRTTQARTYLVGFSQTMS
jgi:hypothetical protein